MEVRKEHKRAMHGVKKSGALHQALTHKNLIREPFIASNWKVCVPLPVNILSTRLTAHVNAQKRLNRQLAKNRRVCSQTAYRKDSTSVTICNYLF